MCRKIVLKRWNVPAVVTMGQTRERMRSWMFRSCTQSGRTKVLQAGIEGMD
jgi:hypothetical protein